MTADSEVKYCPPVSVRTSTNMYIVYEQLQADLFWIFHGLHLLYIHMMLIIV